MARNEHGQFLPGPDPDRHRLTNEERRRGYRATRDHADPGVAEWIRRAMRSRYRAARTYYPNDAAKRRDYEGPNESDIPY